MQNLYTIGHSAHSLEHFKSLLDFYNIDYLLDVRSIPYSKYANTFNKEYLASILPKLDINYKHIGNYFGAKLEDKNLYSPLGYLDFDKVIASGRFNKALENVLLGISYGHNIALMCKEKDAFDCHRSIMLGRAFSNKGINVIHINEDKSSQTQKDIENRLLDTYFPERKQLSLLDNKDEKEYIKLAYKKRNAEIGYNPNIKKG